MHRHTKAPIGTFNTPDVRFNQMHIDLVGLLSPSRYHRYLLTCVDRIARWCEAIPVGEKLHLNRHPHLVKLDYSVSRIKACHY